MDIRSTAPALMGTSEVAEYLGVGKPRVNELLNIGRLPTPVAVLRSGPIWDESSIKEFARAWERVAGSGQPSYWRYVEASYRHPTNGTRYTALVVEAATADELQVLVRDVIITESPGASRVRVLSQRTITARTARAIMAQLAAGTWDGWRFTGKVA